MFAALLRSVYHASFRAVLPLRYAIADWRESVLASVPGGAPFADGDQPYWFLSDGTRVVLIARAQTASNTAQCPPALPAALTGVPVMCLKVERPAQ